jgi:hypothetical protein
MRDEIILGVLYTVQAISIGFLVGYIVYILQ